MKGLAVIITTILMSLSAIATEPENGSPSEEELVKHVLSAMQSKEVKVLERLAITKEEFSRYIWPAIAARVQKGRNMDATKFYSIFQKSSQTALSEWLNTLGGKEWQFVKLTSGAERGKEGTVKLLDAPLLTVRDSSGQEKEIRPIGGVLARNGSYKVTTYYVSTVQKK